jgi:hypothetical protein
MHLAVVTRDPTDMGNAFSPFCLTVLKTIRLLGTYVQHKACLISNFSLQLSFKTFNFLMRQLYLRCPQKCMLNVHVKFLFPIFNQNRIVVTNVILNLNTNLFICSHSLYVLAATPDKS